MGRKVKILAISDEEILRKFPQERIQEECQGIDFIVSCGDLSNDYLDYLFTLLNKKLIYVNGNHIYNPEHDISFCKNIDGGDNCKENGAVIVGFDGSQIYSMGEHQYSEKDVFFQVLKAYYKLAFRRADIVISHSPVAGFNEGEDPVHKGFKSYLKAIEWLKPKYWLHGHVHLKNHHQLQISRYKDTQIINIFGYKVLELDLD